MRLLLALALFGCGEVVKTSDTDGSVNPDSGPHDPPPSMYTPNRWVTTNATGSGDGSRERPWTIDQAMSDAMAGDIVQISAGVYSVAHQTPDEIYAVLRPANSGTPASPIIFFAEHRATGLTDVATNPHRTELRHTAPNNDVGRAIFGSHGASYITWDGFYVDAATAMPTSDSGIIRVQAATGCKILHNVIQGRTFSLSTNAAGYRTEEVFGTHFSYNRIRGIHNIPNNEAGTPQYAFVTMTYADQDYVMEHNEISDSDNGIFIKGGSVNYPGTYNWGTIRFNKIHGVMNQGIRLMSSDPARPTHVYQNLIYDCTTGMTFALAVDPALEGNIKFHHNTIARCSGSGVYSKAISGGGGEIHDNLVDLDGGLMIDGGERTVWNLAANFNVYNRAAWSYNNAEYSSLAAWRAAVGQEANSQVASAGFVNRAGGDFHLAPGSPAATASSTNGPVGCYLTTSDKMGLD